MSRVLMSLAVLVALLLPALPAAAQGKGAEEKRAKVEQRLKQLRNKVLRQEVGLDEQKALTVEKVLLKYEPERRKLQRQHREHRQELKNLLQSDSNDDAAYKKSIDGFRATQKKLNALRDKEMDEIQKLITPKQQAKLYAALERLRKRLGRRGG